jgi:hypothetical protein
MKKIDSPDQLPQHIEALKRDRFYGEVRITFRAGCISRVVTELSQVFQGETRDNYRF